MRYNTELILGPLSRWSSTLNCGPFPSPKRACTSPSETRALVCRFSPSRWAVMHFFEYFSILISDDFNLLLRNYAPIALSLCSKKDFRALYRNSHGEMYKIIFESVIHLLKCYIKLCFWFKFFIANNFDHMVTHFPSSPCLPFLQVFYHTCPEITRSFAKFPTTPTNAQVTGIGALAVLYMLMISMGLRWVICNLFDVRELRMLISEKGHKRISVPCKILTNLRQQNSTEDTTGHNLSFRVNYIFYVKSMLHILHTLIPAMTSSINRCSSRCIRFESRYSVYLRCAPNLTNSPALYFWRTFVEYSPCLNHFKIL